MKPELQQAFADFIKQLTAMLQKTGEAVGTQFPLLLQEKILLARVEHTTYAAIGLLLVVASVVVLLRAYVWRPVFEVESGVLPGRAKALVLRIVCAPAIFVGAAMFLTNLSPCLTAWLAPRVLLLNWLAGMIK